MLEVDRTGGANDGNVYVCWSRFTGGGQNKVYFSRSTDHGQHLQPADRDLPIGGDQVGPGLRYRHRGGRRRLCHLPHLHVRTRTSWPGWDIARSDRWWSQSFSRASLITTATIYNPFDTDRNCGDGPVHCPSDLVFHRVPLEPRVTSDQTGELPGVWLTYNAVKPDTIVPSDPTKAMQLLLGRCRTGRAVRRVSSRAQPTTAPRGARRPRSRPVRRATSSSRTSMPTPASWESSGRTTAGRPTTCSTRLVTPETRRAVRYRPEREIVNTFVSAWTGVGFGPAHQGLERRPSEPVRDVQRTRPTVPRRLQLDLAG